MNARFAVADHAEGMASENVETFESYGDALCALIRRAHEWAQSEDIVGQFQSAARAELDSTNPYDLADHRWALTAHDGWTRTFRLVRI